MYSISDFAYICGVLLTNKFISMKIEKYSEDLSRYIHLVHEATEGRYELSGYDLSVIEAALQQLENIQDTSEKLREIEVTSPYFNFKAKFHRFIDIDSDTYVLVEHEDGELSMLDFKGNHFKFCK